MPMGIAISCGLLAGGGGRAESPTLLIASGDSLTSGLGGTTPYPAQLDALLSDSYWSENLGVSSRRISDVSGAASDEIYPLFDEEYDRFLVLLWVGTNDLFDDTSAATAFAAYKALALDILEEAQSRGKQVYLAAFTILPRSNDGTPVGFETQRQAFNTSLRADFADFADFLIDVAADSRIGDAGDELTAFYSADKVHMSDTGYGVVAAVAFDAAQAFFASIPAPANVVSPAISGQAFEGVLLSGSLGIWTGAPTSFARQWKADAAAISGEDDPTCLITATQIGAEITETVTATGVGGTISATSAATDEVEGEPANNLFVAPRDASGDSDGAARSGTVVTDNSMAGPDGLVLADTLTIDADGYFYKAAAGTNGEIHRGILWVYTPSSVDIRLRLVGGSDTRVTAALEAGWNRCEVVASSANSGDIQFGIDTRAAAGGDGNAKTVVVDRWYLGVVP